MQAFFFVAFVFFWDYQFEPNEKLLQCISEGQ